MQHFSFCHSCTRHSIKYSFIVSLLWFFESQVISTIIYLHCSTYSNQVFNKTISFTCIDNIWITIFQLQKQNWHQPVRHIGIKFYLRTGSFRTPVALHCSQFAFWNIVCTPLNATPEQWSKYFRTVNGAASKSCMKKKHEGNLSRSLYLQ